MKYILIGLFILGTHFSFGQQVQKTLVKTLNPQGEQQIIFDLAGDIEVERWQNKTVQVQIEISYNNANVHILKYLISKGRYNVITEFKADGLVIKMPNASKDVKVNKEGDLLDEATSFKVFVPQNFTVSRADKGEITSVVSDAGSVVAQ